MASRFEIFFGFLMPNFGFAVSLWGAVCFLASVVNDIISTPQHAFSFLLCSRLSLSSLYFSFELPVLSFPFFPSDTTLLCVFASLVDSPFSVFSLSWLWEILD